MCSDANAQHVNATVRQFSVRRQNAFCSATEYIPAQDRIHTSTRLMLTKPLDKVPKPKRKYIHAIIVSFRERLSMFVLRSLNKLIVLSVYVQTYFRSFMLNHHISHRPSCSVTDSATGLCQPGRGGADHHRLTTPPASHRSMQGTQTLLQRRHLVHHTQ